MPRRRKYLTPEEKCEANRLKSKRHYDSNREQVNLRRRDQYQKKYFNVHPI
ncbi:hypothetical protein VKT23_010830 [Stygiomarasmius scandens]|uniref:HNH endonuclease n=1 Tax=Marasmiellus scandens TaxID=2682957 RepID=A0ABR1JA95_9AGAR